MSEFSMHDQRKVKEESLKVDNIRHTDMVEPPVVEGQQYGEGPKIELENEEVYKLAVQGMREKLVGLVQEGHMTEAVAERLMTDFMFNTFNQVVKPKLV